MSTTVRGGKKRNKKPGRQCKSWCSARRFAQLLTGQINRESGALASASQLRGSKESKYFEDVIPAQCEDHTYRNRDARDRRGHVTGRRPATMPLDKWLQQISGNRRTSSNNESQS